MKRNAQIVLCVCAAMAAMPAAAGEFRSFSPIAGPGKTPEGAIVVAQVKPLQRNKVETAMKDVLGSWNKAEMSKHLAEDFYDKSRLGDAMTEKVPRDANMSVLSVQGVQTLQQFERTGASGNTEIISTMSVTAQTQIEFNDASRGFRRLQGTNEYIIRVTEEVVP